MSAMTKTLSWWNFTVARDLPQGPLCIEMDTNLRCNSSRHTVIGIGKTQNEWKEFCKGPHTQGLLAREKMDDVFAASLFPPPNYGIVLDINNVTVLGTYLELEIGIASFFKGCRDVAKLVLEYLPHLSVQEGGAQIQSGLAKKQKKTLSLSQIFPTQEKKFLPMKIAQTSFKP